MTKKINLIFLVFLFLYSIYCAFQLGYTWDVLFYYNVGKERLDYLLSLGLNVVDSKIYAHRFLTGAYNTIAAFFAQFFPRKFLLEALYLFNLIFSSIAIFGIYKITKELFNKEIAKITFVICFFNPIFFGHMSMNGIDTIITFANVWFFYKILRYLKNQQIEEKRKSYVIYCGLLLGLGLGVRYSFIITLIPIFLFVLLEIFYLKILINKKFSKVSFFKDSTKVFLIAYLFMVLFWPQTHGNIFIMPFKLAIESFLFGFGTPLILFNGNIFQTNELPSSYLLVNLFYKMPELFIFSFILFFFLIKKIFLYFKKKIEGFKSKVFLILGIILFPNLFILISPYSPYDGLRLFLFIIPFICIIPSLLIFFVYKKIKSNNSYKIIFSILIFLKVFLLFNFFALTPYHYVYLNIFAGKYSDNSKKFENDYWGVSTKKLIAHIKKNDEMFKDEVKIAVCGIPDDIQNIYLKKIKNLKYKLVDRNENFDFIIMNNRVIWDKTTQKIQTCFEKYSGDDLITVKRRGLIISKITKI
tara:strand:- start:1898 stop:3478 length:1581 start_codon:yes stop_codon:yes gene_type:complete